MGIRSITIACLLGSALSLQGAGRIDQLFRTMLAPGTSPPPDTEFYTVVTVEAIEAMSQEEVRRVLPLAQMALHDGRPKVRQYGLALFSTVTLRSQPDSAELLTPYAQEFKDLVSKPDPLKGYALSVIGTMQPAPPRDLLEFLAAHLSDQSNSVEETQLMAVVLLEPRDKAWTRQVIQFARDRGKRQITIRILQQLGLIKTNDAGALLFIESSLANSDQYIRRQAIVAVSRLPLPERARFLAQLNRLSLDPSEPPDVRNEAMQALK